MKNEWSHPKQKELWASRYALTEEDRVFQLYDGRKVKSYESWQAAVKDGWKKKKKKKK